MAPMKCEKGFKIKNAQCIPKYEYDVKYILHKDGRRSKPRKLRIALTKKVTMTKYQKVLDRRTSEGWEKGREELLEFKERKK